jgi:DNA-binding XRE family transcriptional regulator
METTKTWYNNAPLLRAHNERSVSAKEIAEQIGISRTHYYDLISGRETPPLDTAKRLCAALNVKIDDVINLAAL